MRVIDAKFAWLSINKVQGLCVHSFLFINQLLIS